MFGEDWMMFAIITDLNKYLVSPYHAHNYAVRLLPCHALTTVLFFSMQAIWENQFYYLFGFLFLVFIILIISCSQISIVMVYFQVCGEVGVNINDVKLILYSTFFIPAQAQSTSHNMTVVPL